MEPVSALPIEVAGYTVLPVYIETMFANVVNCYVAGNRRPAMRSRIDLSQLVPLLDRVTMPLTTWESQLPSAQKVIQLDTNEKIKSMSEHIKAFMSALVDDHLPVEDLGLANLNALLRGTEKDGGIGWAPDYVRAPALGYTRTRLNFDVRPIEPRQNADAAQIKRWNNGMMLPSICSPWNKCIGATLLELDRGRFTSDLIPSADQASKASHFSPNERPFGLYTVLKEQVEALQALMMMYAVQGSLLMAHACKRWFNAKFDLAYAVDTRAHPAMDAMKENYEYLLSLPLHPLLQVIASGLQTGDVYTYYGQKPLLYRTNVTVSMDEAVQSDSPKEGVFVRDMIEEAVRDMALRDGAGDRGIWGSCRPNDTSSPDATPASIGELSRQLRSAAKLVESWSATAKSKLGWTSASVDVGLVYQNGADFMLCDGKEYSDPVGGGLLGLRPVLSLGNARSSGFVERYDPRFNSVTASPEDDADVRESAVIKPTATNAHKQIYYSVMTVKGHQGAVGVPSTMERSFLPAGMWMGESDTTVMFADTAVNDYVYTQMVKWFATLSSSYVRRYYKRVVLTAAELTDPQLKTSFSQTSWDAYAYGKEPSDVKLAYDKAFASQLEPTIQGDFIYNESFHHRFVVAMSRGSALEFYDTYGNFKHIFVFGGQMRFSNELNIVSGSNGPLEKIVDLAPVKKGILPLETKELTIPSGQ